MARSLFVFLSNSSTRHLLVGNSCRQLLQCREPLSKALTISACSAFRRQHFFHCHLVARFALRLPDSTLLPSSVFDALCSVGARTLSRSPGLPSLASSIRCFVFILFMSDTVCLHFVYYALKLLLVLRASSA